MASANIKMLQKTGNNVYSDECYTPKEAILPLLQFLPKDKGYYECTSGISSSIVDVMNEAGYATESSSGRNFLIDEIPFFQWDIIVSNPPYSKKDKFLRKAYELGLPFAFLLPVSSLQGKTRGRLFDEYGIELLVLNEKVDFTGGGAPHFGVAWFCHKILPKQLIFV